ncbi:hypothetical protein YC2023_094687 [Brassica napus]
MTKLSLFVTNGLSNKNNQLYLVYSNHQPFCKRKLRVQLALGLSRLWDEKISKPSFLPIRLFKKLTIQKSLKSFEKTKYVTNTSTIKLLIDCHINIDKACKDCY